ncbi:hypothetical protein [Actinoplanes sp. NBRC 103695]|uniref:hypothetical protein n=1 Tax=Actinoplanes sp. NBRC 103695 TaxID=3032202 RepID=UPI0024A05071|nr:hypothetical protein [Actinoplanes sp. NBRC 103695]GLZ01949.1 hypothetical protein Acsp02_92000 [Actinoplanes sp. NBRC 103695]
MASAGVDMFFDDRNTARQTRGRFRYQDECVALRCVANLVSEDVTAVVVEWSTDYLALLADGSSELVSVKHREPGTGEWTSGELRKPLRDLYRTWREMPAQCRCAFASSAAATTKASGDVRRDLAAILGVDAANADAFGRALSLPDPPLPRRSEITAVGIRDMAGVLALLDRDPRYAEKCYLALVARVAAVAVEEPDSPEERIARLAGSLRAISERKRPRQSDLTLHIADLRELVLFTEAEYARREPRRIRAAVEPRVSGPPRVKVGADSFVLTGDAEVEEGADKSFRVVRAQARQVNGRERDVWLTRLEVGRASATAERRRTELAAEAELQEAVSGLPAVAARDRDAFATMLPGRPLAALYGRPPYPRIALDALVNALPAVVRTLSALHAAGKAHRALRPAALLGDRGRLWLRDTGLAVLEPAAGEGPADYRAPEQERPLLNAPGPATDLYQFAAVLFHLATGQLPGPHPPPPSLLRDDLTPAWDAVLMSALSEPQDQRPSWDEFMAGLRDGGSM